MKSAVLVFELDVKDEKSTTEAPRTNAGVAKVLDEFGLDYLVNNAAVVSLSLYVFDCFHRTTAENIRRLKATTQRPRSHSPALWIPSQPMLLVLPLLPKHSYLTLKKVNEKSSQTSLAGLLASPWTMERRRRATASAKRP